MNKAVSSNLAELASWRKGCASRKYSHAINYLACVQPPLPSKKSEGRGGCTQAINYSLWSVVFFGCVSKLEVFSLLLEPKLK